MNAAGVKSMIEAMMAPLAPEGYELWDATLSKAGRETQLCVFVDHADGMSLDGCERVSRHLSALLDEQDPIEEAYSLVVSSPGLDRPLLTDAHFARYAGQPVEVSLYKGVDGRKRFAALLGERTGEELAVTPIDPVTLLPEAGEMRIPRTLVSKVRLWVVV